jgi:hypothetical protein
MQEIVICMMCGMFTIHAEVFAKLQELGHEAALACKEPYNLEYRETIARDDPLLVKAVKELIGTYADSPHSTYIDLAIIKIPDGVEWQIDEYDGQEWVAEKHRTWGYYETNADGRDHEKQEVC